MFLFLDVCKPIFLYIFVLVVYWCYCATEVIIYICYHVSKEVSYFIKWAKTFWAYSIHHHTAFPSLSQL